MAWADIERWRQMAEADLLAEMGVHDVDVGAIFVDNCYKLRCTSALIARDAYDWSRLRYHSIFLVLIDHYLHKSGTEWTPREPDIPGEFFRPGDWTNCGSPIVRR